MISKVKGTRDWLDLSMYNTLILRVAKHLSQYGIIEIATPILEHVSVFKRTLGESTDVVSKEMFIIEPRSDKDDKLCLRPEMTAAIMRACIENKIQQFPWKVFSYGPCFRYERPQKGRLRQFHQITIEYIGTDAYMNDVECITMLDRLFHEVLSITNYALEVNFLGCADDRTTHKKQLRSFIQALPEASICNTCQTRVESNILRIFDCKNETCKAVYKNAPIITDCLCDECSNEWSDIKRLLQMSSVSFVHTPTLVRGLDYYNKIVFEFTSLDLGAQNAFCGGGRYNQLATQLGAKNDLPSIGAAIGIERLLLLLEAQNNTLHGLQEQALCVIIPLDEAQQAAALLLADELRAQNKCTQVLYTGSIKSRMKKANTLGAQHVLLIGDEEQQVGTVTIKNMMSGDQETVVMSEAIKIL